MRRTYYQTCEYCGSNLDPGEKCDCQTVQTALRSALPVKMIKYTTTTRKAVRKAEKAS